MSEETLTIREFHHQQVESGVLDEPQMPTPEEWAEALKAAKMTKGNFKASANGTALYCDPPLHGVIRVARKLDALVPLLQKVVYRLQYEGLIEY